MDVSVEAVIASLQRQVGEAARTRAVLEAQVEALQVEVTRLQGKALARDAGQGATGEGSSGD